jgi:hypothetical protein
MAWTPLTQGASSWVSLDEDLIDWIGLGLTPLLTEAGLFLFSEDDGALVIETTTSPPSPWVPL